MSESDATHLPPTAEELIHNLPTLFPARSIGDYSPKHLATEEARMELAKEMGRQEVVQTLQGMLKRAKGEI